MKLLPSQVFLLLLGATSYKMSETAPPGMPGGWMEARDVTMDVQKVAESVRPQLEAKMAQQFTVFDALLYRSQVVAGLNYILKIHVDYQEYGYIHAKVHVPLTVSKDEIQLMDHQHNKTLNCTLELF